jgi:hypothetical protein
MTYYPDDSPVFDQPEFNPEPPEAEEQDDVYDLHDPKGPKYHSTHSDIWDEREGK